MAETEILYLENPIDFAGETVKSLEFREPIGKDFRRLSVIKITEGDIGEIFTLAGRLSGKPQEFFDLLKSSDVFGVTNKILFFLRDRE
jgi:hypothetical protein